MHKSSPFGCHGENTRSFPPSHLASLLISGQSKLPSLQHQERSCSPGSNFGNNLLNGQICSSLSMLQSFVYYSYFCSLPFALWRCFNVFPNLSIHFIFPFLFCVFKFIHNLLNDKVWYILLLTK